MRKWIIVGAATVVVIVAVGIVSTVLTKSKTETEPTQVASEMESIPYNVSGKGRTDKIEDEGLPELTEEEISKVFDSEIQGLADQVFGNHVASLSTAAQMVKEYGFEYAVPYNTASDTVITGDKYLEFTIYVQGGRLRATISGDDYNTTLRGLEDTEFISELYDMGG